MDTLDTMDATRRDGPTLRAPLSVLRVRSTRGGRHMDLFRGAAITIARFARAVDERAAREGWGGWEMALLPSEDGQ